MRKIVLGFCLLLLVTAVHAQQKHPILFPSDSAKSSGIPTVHKQTPARKPAPEPKPVPPPRQAAATPGAKKKEAGRFNPYLADTLLQPVPLARVLFHDKISNEQKSADAAD